MGPCKYCHKHPDDCTCASEARAVIFTIQTESRKTSMINKKECKKYAHDKGYRLAPGWEDALGDIIKRVIDKGIFYTKPAKTIKPTDILRAMAGKN